MVRARNFPKNVVYQYNLPGESALHAHMLGLGDSELRQVYRETDTLQVGTLTVPPALRTVEHVSKDVLHKAAKLVRAKAQDVDQTIRLSRSNTEYVQIVSPLYDFAWV